MRVSSNVMARVKKKKNGRTGGYGWKKRIIGEGEGGHARKRRRMRESVVGGRDEE